MPSMIPCPSCGKYRYHKSHTRNIYERMRRLLLRQSPYRCHECGYRGWVSKSLLKKKTTLKEFLLYLVIFIIAVLVGMIMKRFML